jgi:hypothetical protein
VRVGGLADEHPTSQLDWLGWLSLISRQQLSMAADSLFFVASRSID